MVIRERLNCDCTGNVMARVKACHTCMQFVQWTLHWFLGAAQIECAYGVPPLFDLGGSTQHAEVQSRHRSMQFVQRTQRRYLFNCTNCMLLCRASTLRHDVNDMMRKCTWSVEHPCLGNTRRMNNFKNGYWNPYWGDAWWDVGFWTC